MSKGPNQKKKLLELAKIFLEETDVDFSTGEIHGYSVNKIIQKLEDKGISSERKSLYDDFEILKEYGIEISSKRVGRSTHYYLSELPYGFEISEIKILVDSVQAAKFISERQSDQIISKLEKLLSKHQQKDIKHSVCLNGRIKTMNSSSIYVIDAINKAINTNKAINFDYYHFTVKDKDLQKKNKQYEVDPITLVWNDENYYLVAFSLCENEIRHYRVDKIKGIQIKRKERIYQNHFPDFDANEYVKSMFGMFGAAQEEKVVIKVQNELVGVFKDRFGDFEISTKDENSFLACVNVRVSAQFYGWLFGLGNKAEIIEPEAIKKEYINMLTSQLSLYR